MSGVILRNNKRFSQIKEQTENDKTNINYIIFLFKLSWFVLLILWKNGKVISFLFADSLLRKINDEEKM